MSKTKGQFSFFDLENQLDKIYELNAFLPKLKTLVDFELFRSDLETVRNKERISGPGRPPFDVVLMFKILVIKSLYNLSDEQTELQIRDRLSFRDFLGLTFADTVPDAKTIWLFAETLKNHELEQKLFDRADEEFKLIRTYGVTGAASHDSEPYLDVMPLEPAYPDQEAFADSAYTGEKIDVELKTRGFVPFICEKGYRNKPLTEEQKKTNRIKSSVRCRIEHIFGEQKMRMGNEILRSIGFARARFWIGMRNLMYNMSRLVSLKKPKLAK